jgi:hypothetical protein
MSAAILFQVPLAWLLTLPIMGALSFAAWRNYRAGIPRHRACWLLCLRVFPSVLLIFLAARPYWITKDPPSGAARPVMLLIDRSESMSLEEHGVTRYQRALDFIRERLLPALRSASIPVQAFAFDKTAEPVDGDKLAASTPKGERTNLGGAIGQAVSSTAQHPLAVIALTDGSANESSDNPRGLTALADSGMPFIGIGFGSDTGVQTLSLREVDAPSTVPPRTSFSISAQLEMMNAEELPAFDLALFRDGQVVQKRSVNPGKNSHLWIENFQVSEDKQGAHNYSVQLFPPNLANLKCVNTLANTAVRVSDEKELRVLYVQGALTWDYKFVSLALRSDPTIKITGLTRTSKQSVFRQNVESPGELLNGFPNTVEELAPYRVVVLSNLRPTELTSAQQDVLGRFCGEMGGGVLMIGGASTFDSSWLNSRLEQLLPVVFSSSPGILGLDRPFHLQLTEEALQHPVFQVADNRPVRDVWSQLPAFTQYGRVDSAKPGAQVWAIHQTDDGPRGRRILMASQHYGAGLSSVLCVQNFWRWRLAKEADPQQFDRFWRQLFRFLSEVGRQEVAIHLANQDLHPDMDVQVVLEKQPNPKNVTETNRKFFVRVEDSQKALLHEESVELEPLHPVDFKFHAGKPDVYTVSVLDSLKVPNSSRSIEIRNINLEFQDTARNMETLRQWASVSDGLAVKVEDCRDAAALVRAITDKLEQTRQNRRNAQPVGVDIWVLSIVLGALCAEWFLRKRWGLI